MNNDMSKILRIIEPLKKTMALASYLAAENKKWQQHKFELKQEILKLWNNFEKELKTQNRYFPKSEFIDLFRKTAEEVKYMLPKGYTLYRARKIEMENFSSEVNEVINTAIKDSYKYQKNENIWEYIEHISPEEWENDYINKFSLQNIKFWGFNSEDSDAPLRSNTQGRVNPIGISYLYTACDVNTAIAEIQPTIEQTISIAKIETLKELKLFNFDFHNAFKDSALFKKPLREFAKRKGMSYFDFKLIFDTISELFSKPILGDTNNYYATQYISEFLKHLEFDGIKYKSSLEKGGLNIVLFDTSKHNENKLKNYEIVSSSLHRITNVKITSKEILPRKTTKT
ncbi:MAG: RES family NAD+ phosphorylase [Candidatus Fibromonas sp.]|jgi:hypothetical protein|nr:RES family NAD+ phosphorylase [Candidatus Fibromonas sp.]